MVARTSSISSTCWVLVTLAVLGRTAAFGFSSSPVSSAPFCWKSDQKFCSAVSLEKSAPLQHLSRYQQYHPCYSSTCLWSAVASPVTENDDKLPSSVTPILLTVLALIVSEGIALSTLPLHLQSLGASPVQVGMSTSAFSVAQMVCCPLLVRLSSRLGRPLALRLCLIGAAVSSSVIAVSTTIPWLIAARFVAGIFAAAIPVAQAGVVDLVQTPRQQTLALSRVSAASQTGLVIGPIVSAVVQSVLYRWFNITNRYAVVRGVFSCSALFALTVLGISTVATTSTKAVTTNEETTSSAAPATVDGDKDKQSASSSVATTTQTNDDKHTDFYVQPSLRIIALAAGWSLTLSVAIYSLFASRFLQYGQSQLSLTYSAGAATVIATQILLVPPLVLRAGQHLSCTMGLLTLAAGLIGSSLIRTHPFHMAFYLLIRVAQGVTDTSTATLVAAASSTPDERANNLGMIQSTRAGARIVTPLLSGSLFSRSCTWSRGAGALPYLVNAALSLVLSPLPMILKRRQQRTKAIQQQPEGEAA